MNHSFVVDTTSIELTSEKNERDRKRGGHNEGGGNYYRAGVGAKIHKFGCQQVETLVMKNGKRRGINQGGER
jgi:hypothetical protein